MDAKPDASRLMALVPEHMAEDDWVSVEDVLRSATERARGLASVAAVTGVDVDPSLGTGAWQDQKLLSLCHPELGDILWTMRARRAFFATFDGTDAILTVREGWGTAVTRDSITLLGPEAERLVSIGRPRPMSVFGWLTQRALPVSCAVLKSETPMAKMLACAVWVADEDRLLTQGMACTSPVRVDDPVLGGVLEAVFRHGKWVIDIDDAMAIARDAAKGVRDDPGLAFAAARDAVLRAMRREEGPYRYYDGCRAFTGQERFGERTDASRLPPWYES